MEKKATDAKKQLLHIKTLYEAIGLFQARVALQKY